MTVPFPEIPKAALLDWDGTFIDTRKSIYDLNITMATYYGVEMPSYETWLQASHPSVEECMQGIGVTADVEDIQAFFHRLLNEQHERGLQNPLYPDAEELLRIFLEREIPAIIISRHPHRHLVRDIEAHGLKKYFSEIIGNPSSGKLEKSEAIRQACFDRHLIRRKTFYLGDTSHDMKLAAQAGVCPVAVSHGYDPVSELAREKPAHIFGSLTEFCQFLRA